MKTQNVRSRRVCDRSVDGKCVDRAGSKMVSAWSLGRQYGVEKVWTLSASPSLVTCIEPTRSVLSTRTPW